MTIIVEDDVDRPLKKYTVKLIETVRYEIELEAESEDDAGELAKEMWADSADPTHDFCGAGEGVEVDEVTCLEEDSDNG